MLLRRLVDKMNATQRFPRIPKRCNTSTNFTPDMLMPRPFENLATQMFGGPLPTREAIIGSRAKSVLFLWWLISKNGKAGIRFLLVSILALLFVVLLQLLSSIICSRSVVLSLVDTMRLRSRSYVNQICDDVHKTRKPTRHSLRVSKTPDIRSRLRNFNGNRTPNRSTPPKKSIEIDAWSVSSNGTSDLENRENFGGRLFHFQNSEPVLSPLFSPRRFRSLSKDQAAKIKRLNARKIEFDAEGALEISEFSPSGNTDESFFSQSIVGDPRTKLLELCGQTEVRSFSSFFDAESLENISKIGEGVYGEVFQANKTCVIKVFPIDGNIPVNGEKQMESRRVYPEVFISKQLTELGFRYRQNRTVNFIQLRRAAIVCGKWPAELTAAWKKYEAEHGSDNECLDFLPRSQEWMILEFDYAGKPLGTIKFSSYREARSVIEQITLSLAAAESALQFEHRDLHWLNVLVKPTKQTKLRYRVNGVSYSVQTEGVRVCIIDFTVSRLCHEGNIVYVDMSDSPEIFECEGDYQFEIYRMMRNMNGNNWRPFRPITNLYWLHYIMEKLLTETSYPRRDPDSQAVPTTPLCVSYALPSISTPVESNKIIVFPNSSPLLSLSPLSVAFSYPSPPSFQSLTMPCQITVYIAVTLNLFRCNGTV
ncbi:serine:threonine protein kinase haspin [Echinococcus multilocularis]|uniref:non-specific serine/threonine protein kinase n=1 Tax=Echinococcus multilocularis TaxID=6211 RepID=A0A068YA64_ECHMU|nr:serine:threonine protein kinase haspin [Echinococcus multilocularis]